jgi:hypothetical protein
MRCRELQHRFRQVDTVACRRLVQAFAMLDLRGERRRVVVYDPQPEN